MIGSAVTRAYLGLGSNLAEPQAQVRRALAELRGIAATTLVAESSLYRSAPMGPPGQPDYINAVAALDTALAAVDLLRELQRIESEHGRVRAGARWGPRTLDLDLLVYGELQCVAPELTVPHPGLHERAFVLYPLHEIAPHLEIPGRGPLESLLAACPFEGLERLRDT